MGLIGFNYPSYEIALLSHQTGLSATIATANAYQNIGTSITIPKMGIMDITAITYQNGAGANGYIQYSITRGSNTYYSSPISFTNTTDIIVVFANISVLTNDIIQISVTDSNAGDVVYIDDVLVLLQ